MNRREIIKSIPTASAVALADRLLAGLPALAQPTYQPREPATKTVTTPGRESLGEADGDGARVHYYHADATALGGHFCSPMRQILPIQAPSSLSPSGGSGSARSENFSFQNMISFDRAYTVVSGEVSENTGGFITTSTAVIEGLNILGVLTATRVLASISSDTPSRGDDYEPTVTMAGSRFEGLSISGSPLAVDIDHELLLPPGIGLPDQSVDAQRGIVKPGLPLIENAAFLDKVQRQYLRMGSPSNIPEWGEDKTIPQWISRRYPQDVKEKIRQRGVVLCSLVKQTQGTFAGTPYGNVLVVPDFGRIFLGEVLIDRNTHRLIMVRVELGYSTEAYLSAGAVSIEGRGHP